jgi:excisionase family DNA binding protein
MAEFPPIMDVKTASKYLLVGKDLLYELAARGEIPHFHVGRYLRFRKDDLDEWSRSHSHQRLTSSSGYCWGLLSASCILAPRNWIGG